MPFFTYPLEGLQSLLLMYREEEKQKDEVEEYEDLYRT